MKRIALNSFIAAFSIAVIFLSILFLFGPVDMRNHDIQIFVVPEQTDNFDIPKVLVDKGYVRHAWLVRMMIGGRSIQQGGYRIAPSMWSLQVVKKITGQPEFVWITIHGCQRREQIGELLQEKLRWSALRRDEFINAYKTLQPEYIEGVYYPDTYLLPIDESGIQIAQRLIARFNEKFAPYFNKFQEANIRWFTALKIASLIEREAAGKEDMKLIAGIIWNRLDTGMRLQIDATMQYTKGKKPDGSWWGNVDLSEKTTDSPYNTYLYKGLPPTPICSPSIDSIEAVLNPEETQCLFYLHDKNRQIHCAKTYEEHKKNIEVYLKTDS